mgnify:CR=1 FL=1
MDINTVSSGDNNLVTISVEGQCINGSLLQQGHVIHFYNAETLDAVHEH